MQTFVPDPALYPFPSHWLRRGGRVMVENAVQNLAEGAACINAIICRKS